VNLSVQFECSDLLVTYLFASGYDLLWHGITSLSIGHTTLKKFRVSLQFLIDTWWPINLFYAGELGKTPAG
jgi:hypothetical protein